MKLLFLWFLFFIANNLIAQADPLSYSEEILTEKPKFKTNFEKWATSQIKLPKAVVQKKEQGFVIINFVLTSTGKISEAVINNASPLSSVVLRNEALRIIKLSGSKWITGKVQKKAVNTNMTRTIGFFIDAAQYTVELFDENDINLSGTIEYSSQSPTLSSPNREEGIGDTIVYTAPTKIPQLDPATIYERVEVESTFKGSWRKYLERNLKYPEEAIEDEIQGDVIILFVVEKTGRISSARIAEYSPQKNKFLAKEALRIIKLSSGIWNAGIQNKQKVRSYHEQMISFRLATDEE